jgi:hypothetical protein
MHQQRAQRGQQHGNSGQKSNAWYQRFAIARAVLVRIVVLLREISTRLADGS